MKRRGPTPSLLPKVPTVSDQITEHEVREIVRHTCWSKRTYTLKQDAQQALEQLRAAGEGEGKMAPYRCPFHQLHHGKHWHIGHMPGLDRLARIALAIRWCAQHPDLAPTSEAC